MSSQVQRGRQAGGGGGDGVLTILTNHLAQSPRVATVLVFYLIGLYIFLLGRAPVTVTPELYEQYSRKLAESKRVPGWHEARNSLLDAEAELYEVHVWFWRFRSPYDKLVPPAKAARSHAEGVFQERDNVRLELEREANAVVGIWSDFGVDQTRTAFWDSYEGAKVFAKRQTFWDMLFTMGRDENLMGFLIRIFAQAAINLIMGLCVSLFVFMYRVYTLVVAYKAGLLNGLLFFFVAVLGAAAMIATFIFLIGGTVAGVTYVVIRPALEQQRARRAQRLHYD